jgi:hypothetical protein
MLMVSGKLEDRMSKRKNLAVSDVHAVSFFAFACHYQEAANLLFLSDSSLDSAINFLYSHAVELALKAFLRSNNLPILGTRGERKHHQLTKLYEECRGLGLKIGADDRFDIGNIVSLLEAGNEDQALRYFNSKSLATPELSWTREVVEQLMRAVEPRVDARAKQDGIVAGRAVKFAITINRPVEL